MNTSTLHTAEHAFLASVAGARLAAQLDPTPREEYVCPACEGPGANHECTAFELVLKCSCPCHGGR